jgi:hypothetical protein
MQVIRYHACPAFRSALASGRWFDDRGRALAWAEHAATEWQQEFVVWQLSVRPPVRLKLLRRFQPAAIAA